MLRIPGPLALTYIRAISSSDVSYLRRTGVGQMTVLTRAADSRWTTHYSTTDVTPQPETIPKVAKAQYFTVVAEL
jgi:hypothetical protein